MDFQLDDDERMLADALERFLERDTGGDAWRTPDHPDAPATQRRWATLANMGLIGLHMPTEHGGLARPPTDSFIVASALGRHGVALPYIATAVVGAHAIASAGSPDQQSTWLPAMAAGTLRTALAVVEPGPRFSLDSSAARLDGGRLSGQKSVVTDAVGADLLIVPAVGDDGARHLVCVAANAPGVQVNPQTAIDGRWIADIRFDDVAVGSGQILGEAPAALVLEEALDRGTAALCAEAYGTMARLLDFTLEHLRARVQFGQALAKFQVLQHRTVDMLLLREQVHSAALLAAAHAAHADAAVRRRHVSAAKAMTGRYARQFGEIAMQIFAGMGMTDELPASRCFRRLLALDATWGDAGFHSDRYATEETHL
ncbi:acyl-CoA/acyl-ACP dehydrogenase [Pseudorhodoferax sp. LjRoot39]|uniref:acyl-CoA dehydrogenase family protein n=1 Tax=Pseudorhodoferax sp. LjRoot39 TaxID=3342328 RepID=UPI003ECE4D8C